MIKQIIEYLEGYDAEVGKAIRGEYNRQRRNLELIASENIVSEPVMLAMATVLTNKYAEGYPKKRYYGGCEEVDISEKNFSVVSMQMFSHTQELKQIWLYLWQCLSREILF